MFVKNVKPAVVVLNGQTVIAPLEVVEVDGKDNGVKSLIESGHLVEATKAETPQQTEAEATEEAGEDTADKTSGKSK
jgi:hypothetical protein